MTETPERWSSLNSAFLCAALVLLIGQESLGQVPIPVFDCGTLISAPGSYQVTNDLFDCPEHGIVITADDVDLDVNFRTIAGDETSASPVPGGVGIRIQNAQNVSVNGQQGWVTAFTTGVEVRGSTNVVVQALFVVANGEGMTVRNSDSTTLSLSNIGPSTGFNVNVQRSTGTLLDRLDVGSNAPLGGGIRVGNGSVNTFVFQNVIGSGFTGVGLEINDSSATTVQASWIFASAEVGLRVSRSPGTLIGGAAVDLGNVFGFTPWGSHFPNSCDLDIVKEPEPILLNNIPGDTVPPLVVC